MRFAWFRLFRCLSALVALFCVGRCFLAPSLVVVATLSGCFAVGAVLCGFSYEQVMFDLLVANGAVVVHHASNDLIRRVRSWRGRHTK
jgi:hypothetical protein